MHSFSISHQTICLQTIRKLCLNDHSGGFCSFEGWVRNHHAGKAVDSLEYSCYQVLAEKEGNKIIDEAKEKFAIDSAYCTHRVGHLAIGDMAVFVAVGAAHRDAAFAACRFIIDEIKSRVPIWKKEHYGDGSTDWPHQP
jgi:molybdopterin synthase catalytic subunit